MALALEAACLLAQIIDPTSLIGPDFLNHPIINRAPRLTRPAFEAIVADHNEAVRDGRDLDVRDLTVACALLAIDALGDQAQPEVVSDHVQFNLKVALGLLAPSRNT